MTRTGPQSPARSRPGWLVRLSGGPRGRPGRAGQPRDQLVIRCLVVPAVMQLLGARAWWLPAPLARRLLRIALERNTAPTGRSATTAGALTGSPEGTHQP